VPPEALDHVRRRLLVAAHQLAPVLGVHAGGEARGVHQVAEEHRQLAALGLSSLWDLGWLRGGCCGHGPLGLRRGCLRGSRADPREDLSLASSDLLNVYQFLDQLFESFVVELELALQGAERDAPIAL
jgi:hypothetical protein